MGLRDKYLTDKDLVDKVGRLILRDLLILMFILIVVSVILSGDFVLTGYINHHNNNNRQAMVTTMSIDSNSAREVARVVVDMTVTITIS